MRGRVWLVAGVVATFGFGAAEAQAGTVFKACGFAGCASVFMADANQRNHVEWKPLYENGRFYERFHEELQVIRPPLGARNQYAEHEGAAGQPVLHETLLNCQFTGFNAKCYEPFDGCCGGPLDHSLIFLGGLHDTLLIHHNIDATLPRVYAEEGDDIIRSKKGGRIDCGPCFDQVYTSNASQVAANCERVILG